MTAELKSVAEYLLLLLKALTMINIPYLSVFYSTDNSWLNQHEKNTPLNMGSNLDNSVTVTVTQNLI